MSNASDPKVEDVLSSVRRLVSSELSRTPRRDAPPSAGALVLTEAQRVGEPQDNASQMSPLENRIAELEAAVGVQIEDDFEPDGSEDQSQHVPDRIVYTRPPISDEEGVSLRTSQRLSQIALIETGPASEDEPEVVEDAPAFVHGGDTVDEAPMAEDVPTERRSSADVTAFADPDAMAANIDARIISGQPTTEPLKLVEPWKAEPAKTKADEAEDFDAALTAAVKASIASYQAEAKGEVAAEDEAVTKGDTLDAREFSAPHFDLLNSDPEITASEMLAHVDEDETPDADVSEDTAAVDDDQLEDDAQVAAQALDALADEEALQLLVQRMIRKELQGELGQTITRNVRKLVRREVKRAISSDTLT